MIKNTQSNAIEQSAMRSERIFDQNGAYNKILDHNVMGHKEASMRLSQDLESWLSKHQASSRILKVLDLACGSHPVSITGILKKFPKSRFSYIGIDINNDQITQAKAYDLFPSNVVSRDFIHGNAWTLNLYEELNSVDIIFSGLNFHHGSPEEILYLAEQMHSILASSGIVLNHDVYKPEFAKYIRKPHDTDLKKYSLLDSSLTKPMNIDLDKAVKNTDYNWRTFYLSDYRKLMSEIHISQELIEDILNHVADRDYPISISDMSEIFDLVGFKSSGLYLSDMNHKLGKYLGLFSAIKES